MRAIDRTLRAEFVYLIILVNLGDHGVLVTFVMMCTVIRKSA